eukprot:CAMPEP_0168372212 /NCGR_PEP_ID=MMETSP0228-20121227/8164_1 /TAXON_ID=133427 /ORGANISM="Protoceratium reticulatum, Strain CCCM 535 (=CCMP 1889)" /LENGTH=694 /DNA_ID=CAMNT_0008385111 /DNA_START=16 /DNA_END=2098 /DNA_ORIENTATION=+
MAMRLLVAVSLPAASGAFLARGLQASEVTANPVRKVVTLLQAMQKKVTEEGEKEAELYKKFACYCSKSGGDLKGSIAAAEAKVPSVGSDIKAAEEQKAQLGEDLKQHQVDRSDAKAAMEEATAIREKEAAAFAKEKAEYTANLQAIRGAVAAISKGMAGGFLQTGAARALRRLLASKQEMLDVDRQAVLAFLSGGQGAGYTPKGGEVVGILKELDDEMSNSLADATAAESTAVQNYEELMSAKKKEVAALTKSVETKTARVGDLAVQIVQMKDDLTDTEEALLEDRKFLGDLEQGCGKKSEEWEERQKTRAEELAAIAEAIKVLNDDDALDLFKKTLPSPGASFVQVHAGASRRQRRRALEALREAQRLFGPDRAGLDFIALALQGRQGGFEKVIKMIDDMVATLKTEQQDDDHKKEYCGIQLDSSDDQKKALEQTVSDRELEIGNAEDAIAKTKEELASLEKSIKALDKAVAEATVQRKAEHEDFTELMAQNSAAKELLGLAINKLNKFYNPKLFKPSPQAEAPALAQASLRRRGAAAAETFGAYTKKGENAGVISLLNRLIKDLDREMTEAETTEEGAQADYEGLMKDSAEKRATSSKSLTEKGALKASLETDLQDHKDAKASAGKELSATTKYIASLHSECDWLLQYFDVRKEARAGEVDSLKKAKAVLRGADYSLVETGAGEAPRSLRRS